MTCTNYQTPQKSEKKNNSCGDGYEVDCNEPQRNFWVDLCRKCVNLADSLKKNQPNKHIQELAIPRYRRLKYRPVLFKPSQKMVEIVRAQNQLSTRAEQLAFPPVRKLIATRNGARGIVSPVIYERYNKYIHRGMYSLYARLANSAPPVIINPIKPWTEDEWNKHTEWLKFLAKPKRIPKPPAIVRKIKPLSELEGRIESLALPKFKPTKERKTFVVKPSALNYKSTPRIDELSRPKPDRELPPRKKRTFRGKKYEASARTKELSQHREKKMAVPDTKENPFQVSPNALKAKTTERMKTLSTPKERANPEPRDPTKISKAALKAKASNRLIDLSKPKKKVEAKA